MDLVKSLKLNNNRIEALVDQMYGINRRLVSLEGRLLRLAEAHGVDRAEFLKQYFGNELDPNWARRVGRLSRHRLARFRHRGARQDQAICATRSRRWRRKRASRSRNSAATSRRCRRASANPASPRRK